MNIYDIFVKSRDGKEVALKDYEGKVLLIVNTATGCGFTPQYTGLQILTKTRVLKFLISLVISLQIRLLVQMMIFILSVQDALELPSLSLQRLM